jgi:Flp pilus assembly pilin Flp
MTENTAPAEHGAPMRRAGLLRRLRDDRGAATAEYVIATMAAVGFAGLLVVILTSDEIRTVLTDMVNSALTYAS